MVAANLNQVILDSNFGYTETRLLTLLTSTISLDRQNWFSDMETRSFLNSMLRINAVIHFDVFSSRS